MFLRLVPFRPGQQTPGHLEMHGQMHVPVQIKHGQLGPAAQAADPAPLEPRRELFQILGKGHGTGPENIRSNDGPVQGRRGQGADHGFHFRQLGHATSPVPTNRNPGSASDRPAGPQRSAAGSPCAPWTRPGAGP